MFQRAFSMEFEILDEAGNAVVCNEELAKAHDINTTLKSPSIAGLEQGTIVELQLLKDDEGEISVLSCVPVVQEKASNGFFIGDIYVPEHIQHAFLLAREIAIEDGYANIMLRGQSGYGKTTLASTMASVLDYNYHIVNIPLYETMEDMLYRRSINSGTTYVEDLPFATAFQSNNIIIVLDELNRAMTSNITNGFMSALDDTGRIGSYVRGQNVIFVATINEGWRYNTTAVLDVALRNRFSINAMVGSLPKDVEIELLEKYVRHDTANTIVDLFSSFRHDQSLEEINADFSTRTSLIVARLVKFGATIKQALELSILNSLQNEDKGTVRLFINSKC